jgi:hypothetical protein
MARMKNPTKRLGKVISTVDDAGNVTHDQVLRDGCPLLNSKSLDVDVTGAFGRNTVVHHLDGGLVVTVQGSGTFWGKTELAKN